MARSMSPEREKECAELSAYINFFATAVWGIAPSDPSHPCNSAIVERCGRSQALQGARQAANDTVEAMRCKPVAGIRLLDEGLREAGLITFSEVSRRYGCTYERILKRGRLLTETEWYLVVTGLLSDASTVVDEKQRAQLGQLAAEYQAAFAGLRL